jgi:hypothetical protein
MSHERPREPPRTAARGERLLETHIGTMLERAQDAPPAFAPAGPRRAQVVDGALVLPAVHPLPPLCIKCGGSESLEPRHHEFRYRSGFLYLALLLGLIPGLVLLLTETRRAPVVLPLCPPCNDRWKRAATVRRIAGLLTVALLVVSVVTLQVCFVTHTPLYGALFLLATAIVVPVIGHVLQRPHLLSVTRIADGVVTLGGVAPEVLDAVVNPGAVAGWQDALKRYLEPRPVTAPAVRRKKKKKKKPAEREGAASASPSE